MSLPALLPALMALKIIVLGGAQPSYWDWQLTEPYDLSVRVEILVIDPTGVTADQVTALNARGVKPYCYISVGTWESYREDAADFDPLIIGKPLEDWPDERYLDFSRLDAVLPIMWARIDQCRDLGFVGIEPDNMSAWDNETGFSLTRDQQLTYIRALADYAHANGMEMLQKNAPELVPDLVGKLDGMIVEECFHYDFCEETQPYIDAGKPVLAVEYTENGGDWQAYCEQAKAIGLHLLLKDLEVTAGGQSCR